MFKAIRNFLWWCAGLGQAERELLGRYPLDHSKYSSVGLAVAFTAALALFTGFTASYVLFANAGLSILFALFWCGLIFNLDRMAVSMPGQEDLATGLFYAVPRILLASLIGLVIAVPLELKVFEHEIAAQMEADRIAYRNRIDHSLAPLLSRRDDLALLNQSDREAMANAYARLQALEQEAVAEADGSGGTRERGAGAIYEIKRQRAEVARRDYRELQRVSEGRIAARSAEIARLDDEITTARQRAMAKRGEATGLLARIEALGRKAGRDALVWWASWLLKLLIMTLEIAPVLLKALSGRSLYDLARVQMVEGHRIRMGYELNAWENYLRKEVTLAQIDNGREIVHALLAPGSEPRGPQPVPPHWSDSHGGAGNGRKEASAHADGRAERSPTPLRLTDRGGRSI